MASSSPPPLIPIHGSDSIYFREENNSAAHKHINRKELQFFNCKSRECFDTINTSSNGEYHEQQSNYDNNPAFHTRPHQLITQSQSEINNSEICLSTTPKPSENIFIPVADINADLLFQHESLQQEKTFSHQEIVSGIDRYWYKKNLENLNTIECLRKEIADLRTKLIVAENRRGNTGNGKILGGKKKFEKKNLFTCAYCRKEYKTEFGLEVHRRNNSHGPGCWMNRN